MFFGCKGKFQIRAIEGTTLNGHAPGFVIGGKNDQGLPVFLGKIQDSTHHPIQIQGLGQHKFPVVGMPPPINLGTLDHQKEAGIRLCSVRPIQISAGPGRQHAHQLGITTLQDGRSRSIPQKSDQGSGNRTQSGRQNLRGRIHRQDTAGLAHFVQKIALILTINKMIPASTHQPIQRGTAQIKGNVFDQIAVLAMRCKTSGGRMGNLGGDQHASLFASLGG